MAHHALVFRTVMAMLATIAFILAGAIIIAFSPVGRNFVMVRAIPVLSQAIGQKVEVKEIGGGWPRHLDFAGISVSDAHGTWLEIDHLGVIWSPLALLNGRVVVKTLVAHDINLLRLPVDDTPPPATPKPPPNLNDIRRSLDDISIDDLTFETLRIAPDVFGKPAVISLRAVLKTQGAAPMLTAIVDRQDAPGSGTLKLALGENTLALNARAIIAGIDLDAALAMSGDTEILSGSVRGSCGGDDFCVKWSSGSLGVVTGEATFGGTRANPTANVNFHLGNIKDGKRSLELLDGAIKVVPENDTLQFDGRGGASGLQHTLPEAGTVLGNVGSWSLAGRFKGGTVVLDSLSVDAGDTEAVLAGTLTGNDMTGTSLTLNLVGAGRLAGIEDKASRTHAELKITKGTIAPQLTGSGAATIETANPPPGLMLSPAFRTALKLNSNVTLTPERLNLSALSGQWGPAALKGESAFTRGQAGMDHMGTTATLTFAPNAFPGQTKPLHAETKVNGPFAALTAAVTATLEEYRRGAAHLTDIKTNMQAKREGANWQATTRTEAKLNDAPITLTSSAVQTPTELNVSDVRVIGAGADLKGNLRLNQNQKALTGALNGPVDDLAPWMSLAGFPAKGRGDVKLVLGGDVRQRADLTLTVQGFSSSIIGADSMTLTATLDDIFNEPSIKAQVKAVDGDISNRRFDQFAATANGPFKNIAVTLQAKGSRLRRFVVDLAGNVGFDGKTEITLTRLLLEDAALSATLPAPAHLTISDDAMMLAPMRLNVGTGAVNAQFDLNRRTDQVKSHIVLANLSLGDPKDILSSGQTFFDGDINLSGLMTQADARAAITARFKPSDGSAPITAKLSAHTENGRAIVTGTASGLGTNDAKLNANIPASIDLSGPRIALDMQAPVSAALTWRGEIKSLWELFGNEQHTLAGQADLDLKVAGNLDEPAVTGGIKLSKGLYENLASGTALHNIDLNVTAQTDALVNVSLAATDTGSGTATAKGVLRKGADQPGWTVDMAGDLKQFHVLRRDDVTAAASGHVTYTGPALAGTIGGNLQIVRSEYRLGESYQPEVLLLRGLASRAEKVGDSAIKLDVALTVPEVLRVEGKGMEAFWRGDIKATGDINHPNLVGELTLARGTFSFLGKTFDLDTGTVTFTGGGQIDPELNIIATRQAEDITATVTISGRASQPQIALSSQPALPQDEVLARLLFRKGTTQLGPIESLQLANAAADLSGVSRGGLSGVLRRASGLDVVGFGGESGNAIVLGRQFSSALYIGIEQNVTDSSRRVVVEWRLTRQFSLQSTSTGEAGADLGILWRKNY